MHGTWISTMAGDPGPGETGRPGTTREELAANIERRLSDEHERERLVRHYVLGRLPHAEAQVFEERFLDDQALLDEINEAERLIDGLRELDRDGTLALVVPERGRSVRGIGPGPLAWALAASLMLGVTGAVLAILAHGEVRSLRTALETALTAQPNTPIVDLAITRSAGSAPYELELPVTPQFIVFLMDAGANASAYRARLVGSGGEVVAESDGLVPDDLGVVSWSIHTSVLRPGDYEAQVERTDARPGAGVRYALRVVAPKEAEQVSQIATLARMGGWLA
jgi:hypothetical protein